KPEVANKGAKDLVFGMAIPMVMLSDEIKAYADYLKYLAKSKGGKPKGRGKGLLTKKGVEVAVENIKTVRVLKKRRIETVIQQSGQSEGVEDDIISEGYGVTPEVPDGLTHKCPNEGSGVTLEVPDKPKGSSSSSSSETDDEIEDISSDDERSEADDMEKIKKAKANKVNDDKAKEVKDPVVERVESLDPKWHKELNDTLEQNCFNDMVNVGKDPVMFDDLMGSTINFTKFSKNCLQKDKITKADLEGTTYKLLKGN
nr:hypothetical protein [Tanacetum cinerariifolium]